MKYFLLPEETFIPKMHFRQPGFPYSACGLFMKKKEYKNLRKQQSHGIFIKDLTRRSVFDKILHDKAYNIAKNSKYRYHHGLALTVYNFS